MCARRKATKPRTPQLCGGYCSLQAQTTPRRSSAVQRPGRRRRVAWRRKRGARRDSNRGGRSPGDFVPQLCLHDVQDEVLRRRAARRRRSGLACCSNHKLCYCLLCCCCCCCCFIWHTKPRKFVPYKSWCYIILQHLYTFSAVDRRFEWIRRNAALKPQFDYLAASVRFSQVPMGENQVPPTIKGTSKKVIVEQFKFARP